MSLIEKRIFQWPFKVLFSSNMIIVSLESRKLFWKTERISSHGFAILAEVVNHFFYFSQTFIHVFKVVIAPQRFSTELEKKFGKWLSALL